MKEKKGDMTIGTLIAIILGLVVLVLLIVGFTGGWNNFMEKIGIIGNSQNTLSDVETYCNTACTIGSTANFCSIPQNLQVGKESVQMTCHQLKENDNKAIIGGTEYSLGINDCDITCSNAAAVEVPKELADIDEKCGNNDECKSGYCVDNLCAESLSA